MQITTEHTDRPRGGSGSAAHLAAVGASTRRGWAACDLTVLVTSSRWSTGAARPWADAADAVRRLSRRRRSRGRGRRALADDVRAIEELENALEQLGALAARLAGKQLAVFLDYDGTLTPIVDRPEDAVISDSMREAVQRLARRCSVCVVSGRDRPVVQRLMGLDDLIVAGSHGFDIWSPGGAIQRHVAEGFEACSRR